jgi:outer membrane putative beta-barrel porin/alpha-amylase
MLTIGRFCLIASMFVPGAACAGPPFTTDDPGVVETGHVELLTFYQTALSAQGRSGVLPGLESHFGVAKNVEVDLTTPWAFSKSSDGRTRRGYGDTSIALKYEVQAETDERPRVALVPKVNVPTGSASRGLGNGGAQIFLAAAAQKRFRAFEAYATGGYWLNRGTGNRNYPFAGVVVQREFASRWTLGAELFGNGGTKTDEAASAALNAGGSYRIGENDQILFSAGRGVVNARATNRVSTYLGYQRSF